MEAAIAAIEDLDFAEKLGSGTQALSAGGAEVTLLSVTGSGKFKSLYWRNTNTGSAATRIGNLEVTIDGGTAVDIANLDTYITAANSAPDTASPNTAAMHFDMRFKVSLVVKVTPSASGSGTCNVLGVYTTAI